MTDRELLEKAAKAAGCELQGAMSHNQGFWLAPIPGGVPQPWNPLASDSDALRLAVRLGFQVDIETPVGVVGIGQISERFQWDNHDAACAATRRAIVRTAAAHADARGGERSPEDAFCDGHCTWLDHAPGCVRGGEKTE